jgi:hypothetical protein
MSITRDPSAYLQLTPSARVFILIKQYNSRSGIRSVRRSKFWSAKLIQAMLEGYASARALQACLEVSLEMAEAYI